MKQAISIIRITILMLLFFIAFIFLFGEEQDENLSAWFMHVIFDKSIAVIAGYAGYRLYEHWRKTDEWIAAYDKWSEIDEEID